MVVVVIVPRVECLFAAAVVVVVGRTPSLTLSQSLPELGTPSRSARVEQAARMVGQREVRHSLAMPGLLVLRSEVLTLQRLRVVRVVRRRLVLGILSSPEETAVPV